ncbi:MAG: Small GTP-binding domain protein (modular protein) [Promethearchaeota archaeon]|nr:MAG: Small GTP-binding domain protein (modular protein) [Candidatus Lokiarchaeota archaeon]
MYFDRRRLRALLNWYQQEVGEDLIAALIVDRDGLLIDAISKNEKERVEEKFIGAFGALVETILKKITKDFDLGTFGAGTFDTDKYRFIFCEAGNELILVSVLNALAMIDPYFAYSYLAAEKIARIFEGEKVSPVIPKIIVDKNLQKIERKVLTLQKIRFQAKENVYKLILGGDGNVGKTSIVKRFTEGTFARNYKATIGTSISKKECNFEGLDSTVRFAIWDLAGQPQFKRIRPSYLASSAAGILVFDVTNRKSFENVENWYREILEASPNIYLILVGNKIDLKDSRKVSNAEGTALGEKLGISYIESSAKTGENINEAFKMLALQLIQKYMQAEEVYKIISKATDSIELGRLDQIPESNENVKEYVHLPITRIWESVSADLIPWLKENLVLLNEIIDFKLEPYNGEESIHLDKLIVRDENGDKVLIIPQFNQTDYYHLGILISSLISNEIKSVLWICEEVASNYKDVIEWLNRNITYNILFYLIELKVLKFKEYPPFPKLLTIIKPPQTSLAKRRKRIDKNLTNLQKIRIDFWIDLVKKLEETYPLHADIKITKESWLSYPLKYAGIEYRYLINDNRNGVGLFFVHQDMNLNHHRILALKSHKKEIEERFKEISWALTEELYWDIQENREYQFIEYRFLEKGLKNRQTWDKIHYEMIDAMKALEGAFKDHLRKLFKI